MCMARDEWYSLYTDAVETVWREERTELKKTAMLIHILGLELSRVKDFAESELISCRQKFILVDKIKTEKLTPENKQFSSVSKSTITPILIPKSENLLNSYVSPDLFHHDSFNFADASIKDDSYIVESQNPTKSSEKYIKQSEKENKTEDKDVSIIASSQQPLSPKLNRPRNLFNTKKYKSILSTNKKTDSDGFKFPEHTTPSKITEEVVQATPEAKKPKRLLKSQRKTKVTSSMNNTLTQMYPSLNITNRSTDSEGTYIMTQSQKKEDNGDVIVNEKNNKSEFKTFFNNYDHIPTKVSTPNSIKKPKCKKCLEYGIKCAQHKILNESYDNTYTGFWDVDFTVDDQTGDDSDSSFRF